MSFPSIAAISSSLSMTVSASTEVHGTDEIDVTLYVSLGVSGAVVVLIVTASIVIICLRMRLYKCKPASLKSEHIYDYISTSDGSATITTSPNETYATTDSIPNLAYGMMDISTTDGNTIVTTSPNEAYVTFDNIPVSSNSACM